jgi:hypothetical protein
VRELYLPPILLREDITQLRRSQEALQEAIRVKAEPQNSKNHAVSLDTDAYVTAEILAKDQRTSISQVLRKAVTTQRWFDGVRAAGAHILVEERGKLHEILDIEEKQPQQSKQG